MQNLLYINGDSYATENKDFPVYAEYIAEHLGYNVYNNAISGSCNSRIFRTSVRDLLELKQKYNKILACVSLSFLTRTEIWDINHKISKFRNEKNNDGDFLSIDPADTNGGHEWFKKILSTNTGAGEYKDFSRNFLINYDSEAETVKLFEKMILFVNFCENNNIDYIISSPMFQEKVDFNSPFIKVFYEEIKNNSNILDIFEFSFLEWCLKNKHIPEDNHIAFVNKKKYQVGHLGESGHRAFGKFLIKKYFTS